MENNNGIINYGIMNGENIASGPNATINVTNHQHADLQQLAALITVLVDKLQAPDEAVANKADVLEAINDLREEIKKPEPKKSILKALGKTVLDNLGYVKTLAPVAQDIWKHISSFIGSGTGV
ncbi:hypothetical protein [Longitalea luteola]|uniref:hypothetical protein n=1 Tax=Longitalea luteola TaxID=2812563 RepID=UPI001A96BC34|nr:hypothetical protein [Longitalea luteola]